MNYYVCAPIAKTDKTDLYFATNDRGWCDNWCIRRCVKHSIRFNHAGVWHKSALQMAIVYFLHKHIKMHKIKL